MLIVKIILPFILFPSKIRQEQNLLFSSKSPCVSSGLQKIIIESKKDLLFKFSSCLPISLHSNEGSKQPLSTIFDTLSIQYKRSDSQLFTSEDLRKFFIIDLPHACKSPNKASLDYKFQPIARPWSIMFILNSQFYAISKRRACTKLESIGFLDFVKRKQFFSFEYHSAGLNSVLFQHIFPTRYGNCYAAELRIILPIHHSLVFLRCRYICFNPELKDLEILTNFRDHFKIEILNFDNNLLNPYSRPYLVVRFESLPKSQ